MRNRMKWFFPILAVLLLAPWPVAYAYAYSDDAAGRDAVRIEVAEAAVATSTSAVSNAESEQASQVFPQQLSRAIYTGLASSDVVITAPERVLPSHVYVLSSGEVVTEKPSTESDKLGNTADEASSQGRTTSRTATITAIVKGAASRQIVVDENDRIVEIWSNTDGSNGSFYSLRVKEQQVQGPEHPLTQEILAQYNRLLGEVDWSINGRVHLAETY